MKFSITLFLVALSTVSNAGEWVSVRASDILQYEVSKQNGAGMFDEGLYIKHRSSFTTTVDCPKKEFVLIKDQKLADRALSSLMYATATNKSMQFFVEGCNQGYLSASIFMVIM